MRVCALISPVFLVVLPAPVWAKERGDLMAAYRANVQPVFENYCYDCHGDGLKKGEFALDTYQDIDSMIAHRDVWKRVREHIDLRLMPPPDEDSPTDAERKELLAWIDAAVFPVDPENPDPGHVTLRRLNRNEYQNTLTDLLAVRVDVASLLPPDDSGHGFDNNGDVLTISPLHMERYLDAARAALDAATHLGPMPVPNRRVPGKDLKGDGYRADDAWLLFSNGEAGTSFPVSRGGHYRITVTASGTPADHVAPEFALKVNGESLVQWKTDKPEHRSESFRHEFTMEDGKSLHVAVSFINDVWFPEHEDAGQRDRNLYIHSIALEGPLDGPPPDKPASHRRIYGEPLAGESKAEYMTRVLEDFGRKAFRRPPHEGEIERYLTFMQVADAHGEGMEHAIRMALEAMLVSPAFLFREEPASGGSSGGKMLITEHALASRLSYFLWSSMPDEELLALADQGKLRARLGSEIERMIRSEKSEALISNFAGQWLQLRDMHSVSPSRQHFTDFDGKITQDMRRETEALFRHVLRENLPVRTLLDADFTFINQRLAKHYGIAGVEGGEFRRVSLEGTPRRGILNHASILTLTSYPTRTSPVLRGKFILENILDTPPPPPPPNIPQLEAPENRGDTLSLREQMERHRNDPACSSCHALMDPIGFGLENFDGVGAWRDDEHKRPIDPSGTLATGESFVTAEELRRILAVEYEPQFRRALASKLLTYALGRGTDWFDRPAMDGIVMRASADGGRFQTLIRAVVESVPFQYRRPPQ
jgi:hypothetical protein